MMPGADASDGFGVPKLGDTAASSEGSGAAAEIDADQDGLAVTVEVGGRARGRHGDSARDDVDSKVDMAALFRKVRPLPRAGFLAGRYRCTHGC